MEPKLKNPEEIEDLKTNWKNDPCWDIEETEGFEAHKDELLVWRLEYENERQVVRENRDTARFEEVMLATGISDKDIAMALQTFSEIENDLRAAHRGSEEFDFVAAAQVRATLLQAAQLKRIADALENISDGDSLATAVSIWGSGK